LVRIRRIFQGGTQLQLSHRLATAPSPTEVKRRLSRPIGTQAQIRLQGRAQVTAQVIGRPETTPEITAWFAPIEI
jgi:hypothetical protein